MPPADRGEPRPVDAACSPADGMQQGFPASCAPGDAAAPANGNGSTISPHTSTTIAATAATTTPTKTTTITLSPKPALTKDASADDEATHKSGATLGSNLQSSRRPSLPVSPAGSNTATDPLSQHIFLRTNTERSGASRLRNPAAKPDAPPTPETLRTSGDGVGDLPDKKKPRVNFLSRLSMRASRKRTDNDDSGSELSANRPDGSNARVFSTMIDAQGYVPRHKEPPRYIRTKAHHKKSPEFSRMFLAQELIGTKPLPQEKLDNKIPLVTVSTADGASTKAERTGGAIWAAEFSRDGRYLAAAGKDQVVRVWAVISSPEARRSHECEEDIAFDLQGAGNGERLSAPVFLAKPIREFEGHEGEVLDLSWSKNNFLLSTSMDRTVRLWHMSRKECLCSFRHEEFVSKVAFHPRDDRFFLAGCLDMTLRLWSIPDKAVAFESKTGDMITAVAFTPDGKTVIAGMLNGMCNFYDTEGLKSQSQLHVRSSRGKNAKGSKITGIRTAEVDNKVKVMIMSTDARVRIYNMDNKAMDIKFKGHEHTIGQLTANFSDDGKHVICPSEDRKVFIWNLGLPAHSAGPLPTVSLGVDNSKGDKGPCESFSAHGSVVTTAMFAPTPTRQLLSASGDPIYDLCNPPPITLIPRDEEAAMASMDPLDMLASHNMSQTALSEVPSVTRSRRAEESPAYIARCKHHDGHIIVTSDDTGIIKVFRQDCAYKRRNDGMETASVLSRNRGSIVGRSGSILTRTSASSAAHSRRGSLSQTIPGITAGPYGGGTGVGSSDHIINWRQGVEANGKVGGSNGGSNGAGGTPTRTDKGRYERSISPTKSLTRVSATNLASERRREHYVNSGSPLVPRGDRGLASPASSTFSNAHRLPAVVPEAKDGGDDGPGPAEPATPTFSFAAGDDDGAAKKPKFDSKISSESVKLMPNSPKGGDETAPTGGFWSLRWPRMPNLRMSISGIGPGPGGKEGGTGTTTPNGMARASSELSVKEKKARTPPLQMPGDKRRKSTSGLQEEVEAVDERT